MLKKIAVSACLLGHKVRYDGTSKAITLIETLFSNQFEIVPVCPEVEAGFGIPRPPMHIVSNANKHNVVLVDKPDTNLTPALLSSTQHWLNTNKNISGFIVKARSPSCAFKTAKVYAKKSNALLNNSSNGLFVKQVLHYFPNIPIIDEEKLLQPAMLQSFTEAVKNY